MTNATFKTMNGTRYFWSEDSSEDEHKPVNCSKCDKNIDYTYHDGFEIEPKEQFSYYKDSEIVGYNEHVVEKTDKELKVGRRDFCPDCHKNEFLEQYDINTVHEVETHDGLDDILLIAEVSPLDTKNTIYFLRDIRA